MRRHVFSLFSFSYLYLFLCGLIPLKASNCSAFWAMVLYPTFYSTTKIHLRRLVIIHMENGFGMKEFLSDHIMKIAHFLTKASSATKMDAGMKIFANGGGNHRVVIFQGSALIVPISLYIVCYYFFSLLFFIYLIIQCFKNHSN